MASRSPRPTRPATTPATGTPAAKARSAAPAKSGGATGAKTGGKTGGRTAAVRSGIGDIMAGVSLSPSHRPAGDASAASASGGDAPTLGRDTQAQRDVRHPIASGVAFERIDEIYRMDPRKIVLEGAYVRQFIEDSAFHQLKAAVELERDIGQHIGVRIVGPTTNQRRVLVYGMRRWKAALAVGLERVPVRDYGTISEDKAVELQMLENEIRADPHPVDTALGFHLLSQQAEWTQKRIGEVFDKNKGYVSEMVRAGEAIARLREVDREPLYTSPHITVRAFQSIAQVKSVEARKDALLALLDGPTPDAAAGNDPTRPTDAATGADTRDRTTAAGTAQAERRKLVDEAVFHARPLRNGRAFRVRWTDDDLRRDGSRIAEEFKARFLEEYQLLLHRAAVLQGAVAGHGETIPPRIAELVASAAQGAARVDARLRDVRRTPAVEGDA